MKYVVELGFQHNNKPVPVIPLGRELLRGKWRASFAGEPKEKIDIPHVLPGVRIELDDHERRIRIYDPLPNIDRFAAVAADFLKGYGRPLQAIDERTIESLSDADVKIWRDWIEAATLYGAAEVYHPTEKQ